MATPVPLTILAERADIHKSCKSLETLVNVLNDYCEAASAVVSLQKKLVKALRETAGQKTTCDIAGNAMNTSATVFEALAEIDSKFSKIADKEYDTVSSEVKKWFKKLAKEEKAHDERIERSNARIKQAGQVYEKKSKKNSRDAVEEHSKYINLISTLGPEMSQEKYNHTAQVSQRHTLTTYAVAACISKVADAEWLRSCEGVRRFSPCVGPLGEWRALCEGGWTGAVPKDLPDLDAPRQDDTLLRRAERDDGGLSEQEDDFAGQQGYARQRQARVSPEQSFYSSNSGPTNSDRQSVNSTSMPSLAHFPAPPTHFPIPAAPTATVANVGNSNATSRPPLSPSSQSHQPSFQSRSASSSMNGALALLPVAESVPLSEEPETIEEEPEIPVPAKEPERAPPTAPLAVVEQVLPPLPPQEKPVPASPVAPIPRKSPVIPAPLSPTFLEPEKSVEKPARVSFNDERVVSKPQPPIQSPVQETAPTAFRGPSVISSSYARGDYLIEDQEFGTRSGGMNTSRTLDGLQSKGMQRSDTGNSTGSVVAAMRNRYSYTGGASSPPPRDVPRLPLSVTDLATRYQPTSELPTQYRATSPEERFPPQQSYETPRAGPSYSRTEADAWRREDREDARRREQREEPRRREEIDERETREHELRHRERDIEARTRELERERAQLTAMRGDGYSSDTSRSGSTTSSRPTMAVPRPSYAATHLVPPSPSGGYDGPRQRISSTERSHSRTASPVGEHPPECTCASCVVARGRSPSFSREDPHRPPEAPIVLRSKPKGWMRRLSMPVVVGNAFSLDAKKNASSATLRSAEEDGRYQRKSMDTMGSRSTTNLGRH